MRSVVWTWAVALFLGIISLGEARSKYTWFTEVQDVRRNRDKTVDPSHSQRRPDNGHYQHDLDYFAQEDFNDLSDSDSDYYDYSGFGDDEDSSWDNYIHSLPRKKIQSSWQPKREKSKHDRVVQIYELEEGDIGNELHDIDKINELQQRMTEIQQEIQKLLNKRTRKHRRKP